MIFFQQCSVTRAVVSATFFVILGIIAAPAQPIDAASVIRQIDAAVHARVQNVTGFTVIEHYAVYRGKDEIHPVAEMTVKSTYTKGKGKSYIVLAESGPAIIRKLGFSAFLDNETNINQPGNVELSWFTSSNYKMKLKPGGVQRMNGRDCLALSITSKRKAPNLLQGTLWVDAKNYSIVQVEGTASKSPSIWTGAPKMMRQYADLSGYSMATHATAVSNSFLIGRTTVIIDYRDYQLQLVPAK